MNFYCSTFVEVSIDKLFSIFDILKFIKTLRIWSITQIEFCSA